MGLLDPIRSSRRKSKSVVLTIPAGAVSADLTNFVVCVRLSRMPARFWQNVRQDGGDVRVFNAAGSPVAVDIARVDYWGRDGVLFFKAASISAAANNTWTITCGVPSLQRPADTDTYGRNAVWSNYTAVFLYGESWEDRTGGAKILSPGANPPQCLEVESSSPNLFNGVTVLQQGTASDDDYFYVTGTVGLVKFDSSWIEVARVANAAAASGSGVDHLGQPVVVNGLIYIPASSYSGTTVVVGSGRLLVFKASDLSFVRAVDNSAQGIGNSAMTYCHQDGCLYVASYEDGSKLWRYSLELVFLGTLTLSVAVSQIQGIAWWKNSFWISSDNTREVHRVDYAGNYGDDGTYGLYHIEAGIETEGLGVFRDRLIFQYNGTGSTSQFATLLKAKDGALGAGGGVTMSTTVFLLAASRPSLTTFTLATTMAISDTTTGSQNRTSVSYRNTVSAGTDRRVSLNFRFATGNWELWDSWNATWLGTGVAPSLNVPVRMHGVYDSAAATRRVYLDGALKATTTSAVAPVPDLDGLSIGREDESGSQPWRGDIAFTYLYPGALSSAWIAAEDKMLRTPASLYSIT